MEKYLVLHIPDIEEPNAINSLVSGNFNRLHRLNIVSFLRKHVTNCPRTSSDREKLHPIS